MERWYVELEGPSRSWETAAVAPSHHEQQSSQPLSLEWLLPSGCTSVSTLVIALRGAGVSLLRALFPEAEVLGFVPFESSPSTVLTQEKQKYLPLSSISPNLSVCLLVSPCECAHPVESPLEDPSDRMVFALCQTEIPVSLVDDLSRLLLLHLAPKRVYTFSTLLDSHYCSADNSFVQAPLLRQLHTATLHSSEKIDQDSCSSPSVLVCPPLESPNMIEGLPAAIVTKCQAQGTPAVSFISLEDTVLVEPCTIHAMIPALDAILTEHNHQITLAEISPEEMKTSSCKLPLSSDRYATQELQDRFSKELEALIWRRQNPLYL